LIFLFYTPLTIIGEKVDLGGNLNNLLLVYMERNFQNKLESSTWCQTQWGNNIQITQPRIIQSIDTHLPIGDTSIECNVSGSLGSAQLKLDLSYKRITAFDSILYQKYDHVYEYLCKVERVSMKQGDKFLPLPVEMIYGYRKRDIYFLTDNLRLWTTTEEPDVNFIFKEFPLEKTPLFHFSTTKAIKGGKKGKIRRLRLSSLGARAALRLFSLLGSMTHGMLEFEEVGGHSRIDFSIGRSESSSCGEVSASAWATTGFLLFIGEVALGLLALELTFRSWAG